MVFLFGMDEARHKIDPSKRKRTRVIGGGISVVLLKKGIKKGSNILYCKYK